jgi:hypothetical protein
VETIVRAVRFRSNGMEGICSRQGHKLVCTVSNGNLYIRMWWGRRIEVLVCVDVVDDFVYVVKGVIFGSLSMGDLEGLVDQVARIH